MSCFESYINDIIIICDNDIIRSNLCDYNFINLKFNNYNDTINKTNIVDNYPPINIFIVDNVTQYNKALSFDGWCIIIIINHALDTKESKGIQVKINNLDSLTYFIKAFYYFNNSRHLLPYGNDFVFPTQNCKISKILINNNYEDLLNDLKLTITNTDNFYIDIAEITNNLESYGNGDNNLDKAFKPLDLLTKTFHNHKSVFNLLTCFPSEIIKSYSIAIIFNNNYTNQDANLDSDDDNSFNITKLFKDSN